MSVLLKAPALLAAVLSLAPLTASDSLTFTNYPLVHKVSCKEGTGTAFRVGANHWMSVAHVTAMHNCAIDGQPITVTEQDRDHDFSRLDTPRGVPNGFRVSCAGFVPGRWYFAVGHALGRPFHTVLAVYATFAKYPDGKRILIGEYDFIPGMSGGPVMDEAGQVVGTANAYIPGTPISLSRELKDTSACA